jgi:hypothetical protein
MLEPLIFRSCFTLNIAPHDGQAGGGVDLIELSGIQEHAIPLLAALALCRAGLVTGF